MKASMEDLRKSGVYKAITFLAPHSPPRLLSLYPSGYMLQFTEKKVRVGFLEIRMR